MSHHPDLKAAAILFSLKRRNAETIFGAIASEIEKLGVTLLDARAFIRVVQDTSAGLLVANIFDVVIVFS